MNKVAIFEWEEDGVWHYEVRNIDKTATELEETLKGLDYDVRIMDYSMVLVASPVERLERMRNHFICADDMRKAHEAERMRIAKEEDRAMVRGEWVERRAI